ncbi:MAG: hypothetical protein AABY22_26630 [Nanoarchaeota archaeon]
METANEEMVEKVSEMRMVEQEITELRSMLQRVSIKSIEVYDCIRNGEVPVTERLAEKNVRKSGTRFEEMLLQLREDCRPLCESITRNLEEIRLLVK